MDATIKAETNGDQCRLKLSGELGIYSATELKDQLLGHLEQCCQLEINLSEIEEIDTAGLQLLVLLKREAKLSGKILTLVSHSVATLEVLELLKMEAYFGDPLVLAS
jgi:anti-anti-sigma factor